MSVSWLERLEEKIGAATAEIERLRDENRTLKVRLEEIATLDPGAADWVAEREEVRRRVERLSQQLEGLLEEAD